ncbi:MAG: 8-oxoguanine deaminase [Anaerolineales bacterium]|nr:8-oxoguanine deaminase [Anaerolineales bacterium]
MPTLLLKHADVLVTMDAPHREIRDGALFVRDNVIEQVGATGELPATADRVINARGMIVLPGLVNTHHHLYQTLTRALPAAQDADLFHWLKTLYPIWAELTPEAVYTSALVGLAELVLTGCTTAADHLYLFPNGSKLDDEIRAAREIGVRFHPTRGSMSLGESQGGLPPDRVCDSEDAILRDSRRVIETFHDPKPYSMCRVSLAPCSPFSVTQDLMRESARLARAYKVHLHTHLAETRDEEDFCLQKFGKRPVDYAEYLEWMGNDVWFAHSVWVNDAEIARYAKSGVGIAHCPSSNMRLASGIAPIAKMLRAGVKVGLGVDGSASNDSSHMFAEARQAMLLQRVGSAIARYRLFTDSFVLSENDGDSARPHALTARQALELGTLGGARVLGRDDIGALEVGKAADFIAVKLDRLDFAGALHDPVAALVFCTPPRVDLSVINGRVVVQDGQLTTLDLMPVIERHNRMAKEMVRKAGAR